jgi:hypothetical protein
MTTTQSSNPEIRIERSKIETLDATCSAFLRDVLALDGALVTDLSDLSDFCLEGDYPDGTLDIQNMSQRQVYEAWDAWVLKKVKDTYGLVLQKTKVSLVSICAQIEQRRLVPAH